MFYVFFRTKNLRIIHALLIFPILLILENKNSFQNCNQTSTKSLFKISKNIFVELEKINIKSERSHVFFFHRIERSHFSLSFFQNFPLFLRLPAFLPNPHD